MKTSSLALIAILTVAATTGAAGLYLHSQADSVHAHLKARAQHLFTYDESHRDILPGSELRKLSIAISFHDDEGARHLLDQLEKLI